MTNYTLYCFADSGNSYKVALYLECAKLDWRAHHIDYLGGETHSPTFRDHINVQGECPVLEHQGRLMAQSAAILTYLVDSEGFFGWADEESRYEILRWLLFDNHKFTANIASYRYATFVKPGALEPSVIAFIKTRAESALTIADKVLSQRSFIAGTRRPSIADLSMSAYLHYPQDQHGFDLEKLYPAVHRWVGELQKLEGWKPPEELMP